MPNTLVPGLRWTWIFVAGAVVAVLTYALGFLAVFVYSAALFLLTGSAASPEELGPFQKAMILGYPFLHALLMLAAAWWVSQRAGVRIVAHGILIAIVSVVAHQVIGLYFGPFDLDQAARYLGFALLGGWSGGLWGRATQARQEALYRASRGVATARTPDDVVEAIGDHLAGPNVGGVAVWTASGEGRTMLSSAASEDISFHPVLLASWTPGAEQGWSLRVRFTPDSLSPPRYADGRSPVMLRADELADVEAETSKGRNAGSVLLVPLEAPGGAQVGLLGVVFRQKFWWPPRNTVRNYQTVGAQAALALENMRLLEEARQVGREVGITTERQRLAQEIHDTLAQDFNSIAMNLETLEMNLPSESKSALRPLESARSTARESLAEARRLVWALRPEALDRHSLSEALEMLAGKWSNENEVTADVEVVGSSRRLPPEIEAAILRTAQETLSNARKHARASRVMLTLSYMREMVVLDARDDGVGFDPGRVAQEVRSYETGGFGLKAMRDRISQLGGSVAVESAPGEGTSLAVELPLEDELGSEIYDVAREPSSNTSQEPWQEPSAAREVR